MLGVAVALEEQKQRVLPDFELYADPTLPVSPCRLSIFFTKRCTLKLKASDVD